MDTTTTLASLTIDYLDAVKHARTYLRRYARAAGTPFLERRHLDGARYYADMARHAVAKAVVAGYAPSPRVAGYNAPRTLIDRKISRLRRTLLALPLCEASAGLVDAIDRLECERLATATAV